MASVVHHAFIPENCNISKTVQRRSPSAGSYPPLRLSSLSIGNLKTGCSTITRLCFHNHATSPFPLQLAGSNQRKRQKQEALKVTGMLQVAVQPLADMWQRTETNSKWCAIKTIMTTGKLKRAKPNLLTVTPCYCILSLITTGNSFLSIYSTFNLHVTWQSWSWCFTVWRS
jgi:hypothetical protein